MNAACTLTSSPLFSQSFLVLFTQISQIYTDLLTKTAKILFECFGTLCLCSAIVMNLAASKLSPSPCRYQNISFDIKALKKKNRENYVLDKNEKIKVR